MISRTFAIGDIHGCFSSFQKLVESELKLQKTDKLILLGDYMDRGSQSKQVIDYIIELLRQDYDIIPLRGNHEGLLLDAYYDSSQIPLWIFNGGQSTLNSFGISEIADIDPFYIDFFANLAYYYQDDNFLFVHAGFNDELEDPFSDTYHMIWHCRISYDNPRLADMTVIHGHCPITLSQLNENLKINKRIIDIDTGCVYAGNYGYGHLSAIEINTLNLFSV